MTSQATADLLAEVQALIREREREGALGLAANIGPAEWADLVPQLDGVPGIDDLWYDAERKRIYASGGRGFAAGFVYVYQQKDADRYELAAKVPTRANAQTSIWVPQLNRYYVSASANDKEDAAILVFEPQP